VNTEYRNRHIGHSDADRDLMLAQLGYETIEDLMDSALPEGVRSRIELALPAPISEDELATELAELGDRNELRTPMQGLGYYRSITPAVIRRNVLENPAWYTAYTPYQPEISQGRLEALLVFQTMVADLTGLATANASLLDEPTAAAEAMSMARRLSKSASPRFMVDADTHPQTLAVLATRAEPIGIEIELFDRLGGAPQGEYFGILLSYPGSSGSIGGDFAAIAQAAKSAGAIVAVTTDLLALTLLESPGEWGADIAVGSAQRFGVPLGYGGPHAGFMAVREGIERNLPGRLVGVSHDSAQQPAYRLALQTREQHIRRERATSNICTSQVLLAVISGFYAAYHGPSGLRAIAERVNQRASYLAARLTQVGANVVHDSYFDTVAFELPGAAEQAVKAIGHAGIDVRGLDENTFSISVDETTTASTLDLIVAAVSEVTAASSGSEASPLSPSIPARLERTSDFLTHPWFSSYHSETAMMRWLRRLADFDLALDRSMIPLGSCTMKLNAAAAMEPITWPTFANIHPFGPKSTAEGYIELIHRLQDWLAAITGYAAVSIQPNAGSQGEFAGLLAIRAYHRANGDDQRKVCLIPASAHGTNAASAAMAGMKVVVVACDETGGVDLADLREKILATGTELAAVMLTYPSTYGVYEDTIGEVCRLIHDAGGQVYVDGANLNALVGFSGPGEFGADVSHLNLHKTFCIPHGGGGPGVGPVAVREHLAAYLPGHPMSPESDAPSVVGPVSGAPYGSAGILPIPYAYIRMMGAAGLRDATAHAVLAANYVAKRLNQHYPVLYTGNAGLVAHECILDLREITKQTQVTVDDVAKRLIDYGFHAPTMSFPIAGTLMVEPTESEDLGELDRFCDAMISIRAEIAEIAAGNTSVESSPLRSAPHTAAALVGEWDRSYTREQAVFPASHSQRSKYWPPVGRIDGAYGDRNLMCSCPPVEAFE
jgi:glycine dehydrogenase